MARYAVDTNVLLRAAAPNSAQHVVAREAIKRLISRGEELLVAPQVLVEFWAVATRPLAVNGYGWPAAEAAAKVEGLLRQFPLLAEIPAAFPEWLTLVNRHGIIGKQVHDARLVALLNVHNISNLLTFNVGDFRSYPVNAVSPEAV
jgi:predicted nucleic acid-binding protein